MARPGLICAVLVRKKSEDNASMLFHRRLAGKLGDHVHHLALDKAEDSAPVARNAHAPLPTPVALQRMQPVAGQFRVGGQLAYSVHVQVAISAWPFMVLQIAAACFPAGPGLRIGTLAQ